MNMPIVPFGGRPLSLDEDIQEKIIRAVRGGNFPSVAAQLAGVSRQTLAGWRRRVEANEPAAIEKFGEFFVRLDRAAAQFESEMLARVLRGGLGWQAAAWCLERRFPTRWRRRRRTIALGGFLDISKMTLQELKAYDDALDSM